MLHGVDAGYFVLGERRGEEERVVDVEKIGDVQGGGGHAVDQVDRPAEGREAAVVGEERAEGVLGKKRGRVRGSVGKGRREE